MPQTDDHLAIMFADIVGSSRLYASLGNERAKEKIDHAIGIMRDIVLRTGGQVIKTIGDEIMCAHDDPETACEALVQMNQSLNDMHFYLRCGICFGPIINDEGDVYGDTVNNAAFLASTAQANQILLDADTYANLIIFRRQCEYFDRVTLKGDNEPSLLYRLNWEQRDTESLDATVVASKAVSSANDAPLQLQVSYQGHTYHIDPSAEVSIGRDHGTVNICVRHKNASRKHCSFSYHRGKFILRDHSTNGTYLLQEGHQEVFLRRESTPILASGQISIGQPCEDSETLLEFHLD